MSQLAKGNPDQPTTLKSRSYKFFSTAGFLQDLPDAEVNQQVLQEQRLEEADKVFNRELQYMANKWAPLRTLHVRRKTGPPLSPDTLQMINDREALTNQLQQSGSKAELEQLKDLCKAIKYKVRQDKREGWRKELEMDSSPRNAWTLTRIVLGQQDSPSPKSLQQQDGLT